MDARRVSSLSAGSTESDGSGGARTGHPNPPVPMKTIGGICLEEIGQIPTLDVSSPTSLTSLGPLLCCLANDSHVWVAEVKLRADTEVNPSRCGLLPLPGIKDSIRYLDCCLVSVTPTQARLATLGERKNKERFVSVVSLITQGRAITMGEELAVYDKVAMLGKNLSHLAGCPGEGGEDLYVFGSIVRKLRVEEEGCSIRPTAGRVPIPPECADGTIDVCVAGAAQKKGSSVLCSSRTKSAGKNKFQLNWFQAKKDELTAPAGKTAVKLSEDQEPTCLLADPRDGRNLYLIANNPSQQCSNLYKLARARRPEDPVFSFPFPVCEAAFLAGQDRTVFLCVLETGTACLRVYHLSRAEGYRGQEAQWTRCPDLQTGPAPPLQALNCSQTKWQVPGHTADVFLAPSSPYQLGLATLLTDRGEIAMEPESGLPYRLRLLGGDQCNDVLLILLEDLERVWETEEDTLSSCSLRTCLNSSPGREGLSLLSGWLMAGRLASVEIQVARPDRDTPSGSDRLAMVVVQPETLRSHLVEQDWTQTRPREGTFVLGDSNTSSPTPATIRSSTRSSVSAPGPRSRIPSCVSSSRRALTAEIPHTNGNGGVLEVEELSLAIARVEEVVSPLARASCQITDSLALLEKNLTQLKMASSRSMESSMVE